MYGWVLLQSSRVWHLSCIGRVLWPGGMGKARKRPCLLTLQLPLAIVIPKREGAGTHILNLKCVAQSTPVHSHHPNRLSPSKTKEVAQTQKTSGVGGAHGHAQYECPVRCAYYRKIKMVSKFCVHNVYAVPCIEKQLVRWSLLLLWTLDLTKRYWHILCERSLFPFQYYTNLYTNLSPFLFY